MSTQNSGKNSEKRGKDECPSDHRSVKIVQCPSQPSRVGIPLRSGGLDEQMPRTNPITGRQTSDQRPDGPHAQRKRDQPSAREQTLARQLSETRLACGCREHLHGSLGCFANAKSKNGRVENLKPWKKGQSGNPAGRPKRDLSADVAAAVFEENFEAIYRAMRKKLLKGDPKVFAVLADRAFGKVKHGSPASEDPDGGTIRVEFINLAEVDET
jgi:Family of unknown function (DUF5681)